MEDIQKKALFSITLVTHVSIVGHGCLVFHRVVDELTRNDVKINVCVKKFKQKNSHSIFLKLAYARHF